MKTKLDPIRRPLVMASIIPTTLRLEGSWKDVLVLEAVGEAVPVAVDVVVVEDMI